MIKYKILKDENGELTIEKKGKVFSFSSLDVIKDLEQLNKQKKAYEAQRELNRAEMKNMEEFHPFVKELSDEDIHTAHMYWESKKMVDALDKKLPEFDEAIAETEEAVKAIEEQCGINILTYGKTGSAK